MGVGCLWRRRGREKEVYEDRKCVVILLSHLVGPLLLHRPHLHPHPLQQQQELAVVGRCLLLLVLLLLPGGVGVVCEW
jgi:hypothetical protein